MTREQRRRMSRTKLPGDHLVLVQLPSGEERLEPILDLSPEGAAILLRTHTCHLTPGTVIPRLRFFTHGACTLDAAATVRETGQISLEDGRAGVKVGLRLQLESGPSQDYKIYDDTSVLQDTVLNLLQAKANATLVAASSGEQEEAIPVQFVRKHGNTNNLLLRFDAHSATLLSEGDRCDVICELYGTRLALLGHAIEPVNESIPSDTLLFVPERVKVWSHRSSTRLRSFTTRLTAQFDSPFTLKRARSEVVDISTGGMALVGDADMGLMVGMRLRRLSLRLPGGEVRGCGIVRNVRYDVHDRFLVGIELTDLGKEAQDLLGQFVHANIRPQLRRANVKDLSALWSIYDAAGLFERQHAALSPIMGRIETTRRTLLERGRSVLRQVVGVHDSQAEACAELVRTYSNTWTLQHIAVLPTSRLTSDQLVVPLIEDALQDKALGFLQATFDPQRQTDVLQRLRKLEPDGEDLCWREWWIYSPLAHSATKKASRLDVQHAGASDRPWIAQKLGERFLPAEVATLDFHEGELHLQTVGQAYHAIGLERRRVLRLAMGVSGPLGFTLVEQSSPGLNFAGTTDAVRIVLTSTDTESRRLALNGLCNDALVLQRGMGRKHCQFLLRPEDAELLDADSGLQLAGSRVEVCASQHGARQIVNFLSLMGP